MVNPSSSRNARGSVPNSHFNFVLSDFHVFLSVDMLLNDI